MVGPSTESDHAQAARPQRRICLDDSVAVVALYVDALRGRELLETLHAQQRSLAELVNTFRETVRERLSAEADLRKFEAEHQRLAHEITRIGIAALILAC